MTNPISATVGFHGANHAADVKTIQQLLNGVPVTKGGPATPLAIDGVCGKLTIAAIRRFQQVNLGTGDGAVDPGGRTLQFLIAWNHALPGIRTAEGDKPVSLAAVNLCPAAPTPQYGYTRDYSNPGSPSVGSSNDILGLLAQLDTYLHSKRGKPAEFKDGNHGYGSEDGKWSTAAKAAKGSDIAQIDLEGLLALIDSQGAVLQNRFSSVFPRAGKTTAKRNYQLWAKQIKENPRLLAEFLVELEGWLSDLQKAASSGSKGRAAAGDSIASAPTPQVRRITYFLNEGNQPDDRLWIWQWDYGTNKGDVIVQKWRKSKSGWLWDAEWYNVESAPTVAELDPKYSCKCRVPPLQPLRLPWKFK